MVKFCGNWVTLAVVCKQTDLLLVTIRLSMLAFASINTNGSMLFADLLLNIKLPIDTGFLILQRLPPLPKGLAYSLTVNKSITRSLILRSKALLPTRRSKVNFPMRLPDCVPDALNPGCTRHDAIEILSMRLFFEPSCISTPRIQCPTVTLLIRCLLPPVYTAGAPFKIAEAFVCSR